MRWVRLAIATTLPLAGCAPTVEPIETLPFYLTAELTPTWLTQPAATSVHAIAPFSLVDQRSKRLTQADLDGKIYVASFIFTRCGGVCPVMISHLKRVAAAYADARDVAIVAHSVDPGADTPKVLARYASENGLTSESWRLVTGDREAIYRLARESYFADDVANPVAASDFLHTEKVLLIDSRRRIRGAYNGTLSLDMDRLIEDIKTLRASG